VETIYDPYLLKWEVQRDKKSKRIMRCFPCHVRVNEDERTGTYSPTDRLIQYMSTVISCKGQRAKSSESKLVPYYGEEGEEGGDHSKWSAKLMKMYLKSIGRTQKFKGDKEHKLRVEEIALQYMLDVVLTRHEEKKMFSAGSKKKRKPHVVVPWASPPRGGSPEPTITHVPFAAALEERPNKS
jgi:hypothetical protein